MVSASGLGMSATFEDGRAGFKDSDQEISFFGHSPTPGHSDDHICLYEPNEAWLFSGDLFINEQVKYLREDENVYSLIDSLKRVVALPLKKMFCSFSGPIDKPLEAIHRKIDYLSNLQQKVEEGMDQGLSPREIQRRLLGRGDQFSFGKAMYSCSILAIDAQGGDITTIEGLAPEGRLHEVSSAFVDHDAQQCGFCTPGFVIDVQSISGQSFESH